MCNWTKRFPRPATNWHWELSETSWCLEGTLSHRQALTIGDKWSNCHTDKLQPLVMTNYQIITQASFDHCHFVIVVQVRFAQTDSHDDLQSNVSVITLRSLIYFTRNLQHISTAAIQDWRQQISLPLSHFHTFTLSHFHTFTLSLSHFHFHTFTLSHFPFHTFTYTLSQLGSS